MYHDDTFRFSCGFSFRICSDSLIFRCGWSPVFWMISTVRGITPLWSSNSPWADPKWSPMGVSRVLFLAFKTCSLKRSLIGRFVSPTYVTSSPPFWQTLHVILYTTPAVRHFPFNPDSQVLQTRDPAGHLGWERAERVRRLFNVFLLCQATRKFKSVFLTMALTLAQTVSSIYGRVRYPSSCCTCCFLWCRCSPFVVGCVSARVASRCSLRTNCFL